MDEPSNFIKYLFRDFHKPPALKLIETIQILGLSVPTLRSNLHTDLFLEDRLESPPEIILQYPEWSSPIGPNWVNVTSN
jgi:hypothetical protein